MSAYKGLPTIDEVEDILHPRWYFNDESETIHGPFKSQAEADLALFDYNLFCLDNDGEVIAKGYCPKCLRSIKEMIHNRVESLPIRLGQKIKLVKIKKFFFFIDFTFCPECKLVYKND